MSVEVTLVECSGYVHNYIKRTGNMRSKGFMPAIYHIHVFNLYIGKSLNAIYFLSSAHARTQITIIIINIKDAWRAFIR